MATMKNDGKLQKNKALLRNKRLRSHIPPTKRFDRETLGEMLPRHRIVYLKPVYGHMGVGIMRVKKKGRGYSFRKGTSVVRSESFSRLYRLIREQVQGKAYLVQKGIRSYRYQGRPFDFRILLQKNEKRNWEVTGIIGRVASRNRIVTNRHQGGKCIPAMRLLRVSIRKPEIKMYLSALSRLSFEIGRELQKVYPAWSKYGIDIVVDRKRKPWILEVNTKPGITSFQELRDRRMYNRIHHLIRWNKRRNP